MEEAFSTQTPVTYNTYLQMKYLNYTIVSRSGQLKLLGRQTKQEFRTRSRSHTNHKLKIIIFLWQITYRVMATNGWHHPQLARNVATTWCTRCNLQEYDDILYYLWASRTSARVWQWAKQFIQAVTPNQHRNVWLTLSQALLGARLNFHQDTPMKWWQILRGIVCWQLWKVKCTHCFEQHLLSPQEIIVVLVSD